MIVQRIQCYHYHEAFKVPFHSPHANRLRADSVIVRIDCGADGCGWGESVPRPYVTGENVPSVLNLWERVFAPVLFAHAFDSLEGIGHMLSELEAACLAQGHWHHHSALGAADLALVDVLGSAGGQEDEQLLPRPYRDTLRFSISVPFIASAVIEKYFPLLMARFNDPIIKVLIGGDSEINLKRLQQLRRLAGENVEIRLEVNGRMNREQVLKEIDRLRRFGPAAVEQPLPRGDIEGLRQLRENIGLAVVVDESLISLTDAKELLAAQACDIFNIKISKCGGLMRSAAIAQLAAQAGINCQVGTHVGESEVLGAAGRQLARGIPNFDCYGGGSPLLFARILDGHTATARTASMDAADESLSGPSPMGSEASILENSTLCLDLETSP